MAELNKDQESVAPNIASVPIGQGHPEYHFVQSVLEMQKTLSEISVSIKHLEKSVDSVKSKADDLVKWKHMILGGAVTIGFLIGGALTIYKMLH